jgi:iron complex transport system ATP-binding protein
MKNAIAIDRLSYAYGKSAVLKHVRFSVASGDFFVIIGPNGSGKTTLMKLMAGLEKLPEGKLSILGREIQNYKKKDLARKIAFVPQEVPTDFPFSVMEVVLMGRSPYQGTLGLERARDVEKARQAITFTGISHLADRKLNALSGGERQRVFIARAICQEPEIMLLDEPTASLDLAHQIRIMDLMEKLQQEKKITIVMVSHDLNLAAMYGTRLLLLNKGQIVKIGLPEEVLTFQTLEDAYGCTLLVDENPLGKFPRVNLVPGKFIKQ